MGMLSMLLGCCSRADDDGDAVSGDAWFGKGKILETVGKV